MAYAIREIEMVTRDQGSLPSSTEQALRNHLNKDKKAVLANRILALQDAIGIIYAAEAVDPKQVDSSVAVIKNIIQEYQKEIR